MTVQLTDHQINVFKTKLNDRFIVLRREISGEEANAHSLRFTD